MKYVHLTEHEDIISAFNDVRGIFPNLSTRVNVEDYLEKISNNAQSFAIFDEDNSLYCGFCAMYMNDFESRIAFISLIGLRRDYLKMHLGGKLLSFCENNAKEFGMNSVKLEVNKKNLNARGFYNHCGYKEIGENETSIFMKKEL